MINKAFLSTVTIIVHIFVLRTICLFQKEKIFTAGCLVFHIFNALKFSLDLFWWRKSSYTVIFQVCFILHFYRCKLIGVTPLDDCIEMPAVMHIHFPCVCLSIFRLSICVSDIFVFASVLNIYDHLNYLVKQV